MTFHAYLDKSRNNALEELAVLDSLTKALKENQSLSPIEYRAAKAALQVLIGNAIGLSMHLLRHYESPITPMSANDAFRIMRDVGMIDDESYSLFIKAVGFRNVMIHDYMNFNPEVLAFLLKSQDFVTIGAFLTEQKVYPDLILNRLKTYAPIV